MSTHRLAWLAALAALAIAPSAAQAATGVTPVRESAPFFDDEDADADDPAIWVNPLLRDRSVVVGTLKNAGLVAFGLDGQTVQRIAAPAAPGEDDAEGRFNNVDVVYDARIGGINGDFAIVSDRGSDRIRTYRIDPLAASLRRPPLRDVSAPNLPFVFNATQAEVNDQATAYGLAAWVDERTGTPYVVTSRRSRSRLALLKLVPAPGGKVTTKLIDTIDAPTSFTLPSGGTWSPCVAEEDEQPQFEGMTIDADRGTLFAGQEDVGIWKVSVSPGGFGGDGALIEKVKEFGAPYTLVPDDDPGEFECETTGDALPGDGGTRIAADVEGLTIYRGAFGTGYLLASSQGDDTFAAFGDRGRGGYLGSFEIVDGPGADGVQESDGAAVVNVPLGRDFPRGLLVTHDGKDETGTDRDSTNFKLTRWEDVANIFDPKLRVDPFGWFPRLG